MRQRHAQRQHETIKKQETRALQRIPSAIGQDVSVAKSIMMMEKTGKHGNGWGDLAHDDTACSSLV